jgi:CBS domain-containing protein
MLIDAVLLESQEREVISIGPEATVQQAVLRMVLHNIGSLPVLDDSDKVIGSFTERDVLMGECGDTKRFHGQRIKEVMTPAPVTCSASDSVHEAMNKMSQYHVGQLPVVDDGKLVGVVSIGDLIRALHGQAEAEKEHLINYVHGRN